MCEFWDELSVISRQSQESLKFHWYSRRWPISYCLDLLFLSVNAVSIHPETHKRCFQHAENILGSIQPQACITQCHQYAFDMSLIRCQYLREDEDIDKVYDCVPVVQVQDPVHHTHECHRSICKSEHVTP